VWFGLKTVVRRFNTLHMLQIDTVWRMQGSNNFHRVHLYHDWTSAHITGAPGICCIDPRLPVEVSAQVNALCTVQSLTFLVKLSVLMWWWVLYTPCASVIK